MRIILVGYSELAASLLIGLLESKHKIVGIMRWEKSKGNKFGLINSKNKFQEECCIKTIKKPSNAK